MCTRIPSLYSPHIPFPNRFYSKIKNKKVCMLKTSKPHNNTFTQIHVSEYTTTDRMTSTTAECATLEIYKYLFHKHNVNKTAYGVTPTIFFLFFFCFVGPIIVKQFYIQYYESYVVIFFCLVVNMFYKKNSVR